MSPTSDPRTGPNDQRSSGDHEEILLIYDQECPACDIYCRSVNVEQSMGRLSLINARDSSPIMEKITEAGLDIDQGMVVQKGEQLYYGGDAIHVLALLSNRSDLFNKLSYYVFRSKALARILYPILRFCRNLLLKALGKTKINNLRIKGNDRF